MLSKDATDLILNFEFTKDFKRGFAFDVYEEYSEFWSEFKTYLQNCVACDLYKAKQTYLLLWREILKTDSKLKHDLLKIEILAGFYTLWTPELSNFSNGIESRVDVSIIIDGIPLCKIRYGCYVSDNNYNRQYVNSGDNPLLAIRHLSSLVDCTGCLNCRDCIDCHNCTNLNGGANKKFFIVSENTLTSNRNRL